MTPKPRGEGGRKICQTKENQKPNIRLRKEAPVHREGKGYLGKIGNEGGTEKLHKEGKGKRSMISCGRSKGNDSKKGKMHTEEKQGKPLIPGRKAA